MKKGLTLENQPNFFVSNLYVFNGRANKIRTCEWGSQSFLSKNL